ncbi:MAG: cobalamin-binding protein [Rubrobacter sp.]
MRIASLLPSATEMVHFAGAESPQPLLVGVTHECDFPPGVEGLPHLTSSKIDHKTMTSREIDEAVGEMSDAGSLYALDAKLLEELCPDLVVTQGLCEVCAVSESLVKRAVSRLSVRPEVLILNPTSMDDVLEDSLRIARAIGTGDATGKKVAGLRSKLDAVGGTVSGLGRPRVACIEWLDPPFSAGHWVPEMVRLAGGEDVLAAPGEASRRISWEEVAEAEPEVVVLMPCGFGVQRAMEEVPALGEIPAYQSLAAVKKGNVWVVDANSHFSRPAPRLVDGVEILAKLLHPGAFPGKESRASEALRLTNSSTDIPTNGRRFG